MEITQRHKSHRWKFLVGGTIFSCVSAVDDFIGADPSKIGVAGAGLITAIPVGLLFGYVAWWAWAKTKKLDP